MVLQKRFCCGSRGYRVPAITNCPQSVKGKLSVRKKVADNQMCALNLLVTVAKNVLLHGEDSILYPQTVNGTSKTTSIAMVTSAKDQSCIKQPLEMDTYLEQRRNENDSSPVVKDQITLVSMEPSQASRSSGSRPDFRLEKSDISDDIARESFISNNRVEFCYPVNAVTGKCGTAKNSPTSANFQGRDMTKLQNSEGQLLGNRSDGSTEVLSCRNCVHPTSSSPKHESGVEVTVDRDDDDKSSGCICSSDFTKMAARRQCLGDYGKRKLFASNYRRKSLNWKLNHAKVYKYGMHARPNSFIPMKYPVELIEYITSLHTETETKPGFCRKEICYARQRTSSSYFNRRKLLERQSVSASNNGFFSKEESNLHEKDVINTEACDPLATHHTTIFGVHGALSSKVVENPLHDSVKLCIKSFEVPELFIEIPETATIGSLKTTVMKAVTAIVQGGMHIGVLLQGKEVRDDRKSLREAGISHVDKLDNLGFTWEPNQSLTPQTLTTSGDCQSLVEDSVEPQARIYANVHSIDFETSGASQQPTLTSCPENNHDSVHSPIDTQPFDKPRENSQALVACPPMSTEALVAVPLRQSRGPEHVERRNRRSFSVAAVEALVLAVEGHGIGRWRDVKLWAFENEKHLTYVDLKDKWKTLVHTAWISPQQRRGEIVPQELLDRVLSAQAYWSQQQTKEKGQNQRKMRVGCFIFADLLLSRKEDWKAIDPSKKGLNVHMLT